MNSQSTEARFALNYFESVLGLRFVPQFELTTPRLLILDLPSPGGLAQVEMFQKMMTAIGFAPSLFEVVEALPSELGKLAEKLSSAELILSFSEELSEVLRENIAQDRLTTLKGPRDLATQPGLKRETWTGLQDLSRRLSTSKS